MAGALTIVNGPVAGAPDAAGPSAIIGTGVRLTVVGGRIVHRSED